VFGFADWNGRSHTDNASDVMFSVASNTPVHLGIGKESVTSKPSKGFPYVPAVVYVTAVACGNGLLLAGLHPHRTAWRMRHVPKLFSYGRRYGRDLR